MKNKKIVVGSKISAAVEGLGYLKGIVTDIQRLSRYQTLYCFECNVFFKKGRECVLINSRKYSEYEWIVLDEESE